MLHMAQLQLQILYQTDSSRFFMDPMAQLDSDESGKHIRGDKMS